MKKHKAEVYFIYHTRANITRGLYIFHPIFQFGLWSRAIDITDNLCAKQEMLSLKSAVYNQERVIIARVW